MRATNAGRWRAAYDGGAAAVATAYGLFTPPGLIWVRYDDDALLIDQYTGEILQVRYDVLN